MSNIKYVWGQAGSNGDQSLTVKGMDWTENPVINEKLVLLTQTGASMAFHFSMTPAQARQMAMALIAAAESLA